MAEPGIVVDAAIVVKDGFDGFAASDGRLQTRKWIEGGPVIDRVWRGWCPDSWSL